MSDVLNLFHPLVAQWFQEKVGVPTPVQVAAWPEIACGRHVLATAPTGSGKTLTAFLWALNQLSSGAWERGSLRVVYVSPLKALNNDIRQNLMLPLEGLKTRFRETNQPWPDIRVMVRSGDTESSERQRMLRRPPEILITTPESLNLLLSSRRAQHLFTELKTVIVDELHAILGDKRGVHLITAIDRLVLYTGEFQRVGLSATLNPPEEGAAFLGGYTLDVQDGEAQYQARPVHIVRCDSAKQYDLSVRFPGAETGVDGRPMLNTLFSCLADAFREVIREHRSTLIFTNTRRHSERLSMLINQEEAEPLAYAHHGSLSRDIRAAVEKRLKAGTLRAIVATSSLELGIDIGSLDRVLLVQTPQSVTSTLQRLGRAGHQVGAVSSGTLYPTHARDLIDAAVMVQAVRERDIEPVHPISCPLDVLAQIIVSMTGVQSWHLETLYAFLRTSWPYHSLSRTQFDLVVEMLAGRYSQSRLRALDPLVSVDKLDGTITGKDAALRRVYSSGGTIPDHGCFTLRRKDTRARLGELDEEFVWERRIGDRFAFGVQSWRITDITHNDVLVEPAQARASDPPFWRAESIDRCFAFSERVALFLESANESLDAPWFRERLITEHGFDEPSADSLLGILHRQRAFASGGLPHRRHLLIEALTDARDDSEGRYLVLHTLWGGQVNRPLSLAMAQAWENRFRHRVDVYADNDCIILMLPLQCDPVNPFDLVTSSDLERLFRQRLEASGYFGTRFRENAARALLLTRGSFGRRTPLWLNKMRGRALYQAVTGYDDFPILVETWRACLQDEFDMEALRSMLDEVKTGAVRMEYIETRFPSPFASDSLWRFTNIYLYMDESLPGDSPTRLRDEILSGLSPQIRPRIPDTVAHEFECKVQRLAPGYTPRTPEDLLDWVKERLLLPLDEWQALLDAIQRDSAVRAATFLKPILPKLVHLTFLSSCADAVVALEYIPRIYSVLGESVVSSACLLNGERVALSTSEDASGDMAIWLVEWLRFYGPMSKDQVTARLPISLDILDTALALLLDDQSIVMDELTKNAQSVELCDAENYETLLRLSRTKARPSFEPLPAVMLQPFIAWRQGVARCGVDAQQAIEPLFGLPLSPGLLETDVLPARLDRYATSMIDTLMTESDLMWFGCEKKRVVLCLAMDYDLFLNPEMPEDDTTRLWEQIAPRLFADKRGQYHFDTLLDYTRLSREELTESLWEFVWEGRITNDTFAVLRRGLEHNFKHAPERSTSPTRRNIATRVWGRMQQYPGAWRMLPAVHVSDMTETDLLDMEEMNRNRIQVLLDRYGVLFREILQREFPWMRWGPLFKTLRRMELAGELVAGHFFEGSSGLQFMSWAAFRELERFNPTEYVYWMNTSDPASLCGVDIEGVKGSLPARSASTHMVFDGPTLVVVSRRNGQELDIRVPRDHPRLQEYLGFIEDLQHRERAPLDTIGIETINKEPAVKSPYLTMLRDWFEVCADSKRVTIWKTI